LELDFSTICFLTSAFSNLIVMFTLPKDSQEYTHTLW